MAKNDYLETKKFSEINLNDTFFDSLRKDYEGFNNWYTRKADKGEEAYVMYHENELSGFMYLKDETETIQLELHKLEKGRRLKIGTFKLNSRGTVLGERFLSRALRDAVSAGHDRAYVTVFEKHVGIVKLFKKFGFEEAGKTQSGELFLGKRLKKISTNPYKNFPRVLVSDTVHSLAIYPDYHTRLFPDSKLKTEKQHVVKDVALTNTISKTYLTKIKNVESFKPGDTVFIYRMSDKTPKKYHSAITSVCTIIEVKKIEDFIDYEVFLNYIGKGTVFSEGELNDFWVNKTYPIIVKMIYNFPMIKKIILNDFSSIIELPMSENPYWGSVDFSDVSAFELLKKGKVDESFIINKP